MAEIEFRIEARNGLKATGRLVWAAKSLNSPAISGPHGQGYLPNGLYTARRGALVDDHGPNDAFCDRNSKCWFQGIIKDVVEPGRSGFGIHPDGNVLGTEGCIGLSDANTKPWYDAFYAVPGSVQVEVKDAAVAAAKSASQSV